MKKQSLKFRLALYLLILISLVVVLGKFNKLPQIFRSSTFSFSFDSSGSMNSSALTDIINASIDGFAGEYAFYIENLQTGEKYLLNASDDFPSASLYKLFLLAAAYKEIENGNLKLTDTLSAPTDYLVKRYGSLDFGYEDAGDTVSFTVNEAMQRIGRISDNFAAILLTDKIGIGKVAAITSLLGAADTNFKADPISTTALDVGSFFKKLYLGQVVSQAVSDQIIATLELNQINDRIPANLPVNKDNNPNSWIAVHKTGELADLRHDAGLVYLLKSNSGLNEATSSAVLKQNSKSAYVIVMMAKDVNFEDDTVNLEAEISQKVYQYFLSRK